MVATSGKFPYNSAMSQKLISKNKKAYFDYELLETFEAGIKLTGAEAKSVKGGGISISEAYVKEWQGGLILWNATIQQYKHSFDPNYDSGRARELLLKKREIQYLIKKTSAERLTIIPTRVYLTRGFVKIAIALAKGKKSYEKQRKIKERDLERELHREKRKFMVK